MATNNIFTEEQVLALEEHESYYQDMVEYIRKRKSGEMCSLPKKPKSKIDFLEQKVFKGVMSASDLHQYLLNFLAPENMYLHDPTVEDKERFEKCETIDEIASFLVVAADLIKLSEQKNHESLSAARALA